MTAISWLVIVSKMPTQWSAEVLSLLERDVEEAVCLLLALVNVHHHRVAR